MLLYMTIRGWFNDTPDYAVYTNYAEAAEAFWKVYNEASIEDFDNIVLLEISILEDGIVKTKELETFNR